MSTFDWQVLPEDEGVCHHDRMQLSIRGVGPDMYLWCPRCHGFGSRIPHGELVDLIVTAAESLAVDYDPNLNPRSTS